MRKLIHIPLLLLVATVFAPSVAAQPSHLPIARTSDGLSLNWSGYAVSDSDVTAVQGTFTVPTISGPGSIGGLPPDVSAWVGIDGYTSGTVEQTGIAGSYDSSTNTASYYAWWEMYPRNSMVIHSLSISAGDSITASVAYNGGGSFTLSISDNTNGQSFTKTVSAPVGGPNAAQRTSAEWVVERAATIYKGYLTILPLATFDSVSFSSATYSVGAGSTFTLQQAVDTYQQYAGYPNPPPAQPYWEQITMAGFSGASLIDLDAVTAVSSNTFSVSFLANGDPYPIPGVFRQN